MQNKKQMYRKITRMMIALLCCFPVFLVISALLEGADDFLIMLCNLVVGGTILFFTFIIGDKLDEKREMLHQKHLEEIEERKRIEKVSKGLVVDQEIESQIIENKNENDK